MHVGRRKSVLVLSAMLLLSAAQVLRAQGIVVGRVTATGTNEPLSQARVLVIGTSNYAITNEDGRFSIKGVRAGSADVQVLRVGFASLKKTVTISNGTTVTADFVLAKAVIQLDEVVTTATGQQRRIELGNAISTLGDVNKRVEENPVNSLSDLLVAKAPGVVLLPPSVVGGQPFIRIRGISSISLSNAPIWVVDGVRYNSSSFTTAGQSPIGVLNNLSPEEIEDIEIVKGPSAATLYGTNAANGVIVVTTKKGRAGTTKWNWTAESRTVSDRNDYQTPYANFGKLFNSAGVAAGSEVRCQLGTMETPSFTFAQGAKCKSDSLTSYNLLKDPTNTPIHLGRGSLAGMNVSGGSEALRFFASADIDNEFGPVQMPQQDISFFQDSLHVPVSNTMLHPRAQQKLNFRTNVNAALNPKFDLNVNAGFGKSSNFIEPDNSLIIGMLYTGQASYGWKGCPAGTEGTGCGMTGSDAKQFRDPTGFPLHDYNSFAPGTIMQYITSFDVQRFTGSTQATWRPFTWLQNEGTVGVDLFTQDSYHVCKLNECPNSGATARQGNVFDSRENDRNFSAKLSTTATWQAKPWANLNTAFGADYTNTEREAIFAQGRGLAPGASALGSSATFVSLGSITSSFQPTAVKTLGYYGQEQISLRDRLFLTVGVRQDQNSAFGANFLHVLYPKASVSWLTSEEGFFPKYDWLNLFRLRAAYGANGVQPGATAALQTFTTTTTSLAKVDAATGVDIPGIIANLPGNSLLKPEKSTELETGFEMDMFGRRIHLDYTYYNKKTTDALINVPIPSSVGSPVTSLLQNVGSTQNWGHEVQMNIQLLDRPRFGWDVTVNASHNNNQWVDLGIDPSTGVDRIIQSGTAVLTKQMKGLPLNSQWYRNFTFADANHDGVIQVSEVVVDSAFSYQGVGFAKDVASVTSGIDLFSHKMRVNASFDYKGGGNTLEGNYFQCTSDPQACRETQDPSAPLELQARAVALKYGTKYANGTTYTTRVGYFSPFQAWRFRELSGVVNLPDAVLSRLRAQRGSSLVVGMRNIHVWTKFTGVDPEQNYGVSGSEVQQDFNTSPPPSYFTFRVNLKY
ncbi:MAG: hypothetical protein JWM95_2156 [Gemmatimonadetes bacterium]|nr:hypothetical protein [Gemmatimonadota bacterium]